ncbi:hypothetical protein Vadar_009177 [Vaccinium darrowii]|uniref:Uncharacterized protein n=1 Tax=Vaccinium darrowii TaxID=229202 RepID=A0ACB7Z2F8_9ERIC|nr:hypothetical protein Vadar_009177 [Vaccinium darrowii]
MDSAERGGLITAPECASLLFWMLFMSFSLGAVTSESWLVGFLLAANGILALYIASILFLMYYGDDWKRKVSITVSVIQSFQVIALNDGDIAGMGYDLYCSYAEMQNQHDSAAMGLSRMLKPEDYLPFVLEQNRTSHAVMPLYDVFYSLDGSNTN